MTYEKEPGRDSQERNGVMKKFRTNVIAKTTLKKPNELALTIKGVANWAIIPPMPKEAATVPIAIHPAIKKTFCQLSVRTLSILATLIPGRSSIHGAKAKSRLASTPVHGPVKSMAKKMTRKTAVFFSVLPILPIVANSLRK